MWCLCYMCAMRSAVGRIKTLGANRGHLTHLARIWTNKWPATVRYWSPVVQILGKSDQTSEIDKSKLFFVIHKTISVIPYPYNFLVSYPLSLILFCQLSLIPKTPNRASREVNVTFWNVLFQSIVKTIYSRRLQPSVYLFINHLKTFCYVICVSIRLVLDVIMATANFKYVWVHLWHNFLFL